MAIAIEIFSAMELTLLWVYLLILAIIGILANGIILYLFACTKTLRTPMNSLFVSLTLGDFLVSLIGTFVSAMFTLTRTAMGQGMCEFYGFVTYFGGSADAVALTTIAIERYLTIARPFGIGNMTFKRTGIWLGYTWIVSAVCAGLPLVGISKYVNEGAGTWCSIDWEVKNFTNDIYVIFIFVMNYFSPIVIIILCYYVVVAKVKEVAKTGASESSVKAEKAVTRQAVAMVIGFLVAWTPYAFVCLVATFSQGNPFSPRVAVAPALLAKSSFCYNPFIYVGLNKQFRKAFVEKVLRGYDPFGKKEEEQKVVKVDSSLNNTTVAVTGVINAVADVPTVSNNVGGPSLAQKVSGNAAKVGAE